MARRINARLVLELLGRGMSAREIYRIRHISQQSVKKVREADYDYVHAELQKVGVNQKLLWEELRYDKSSTVYCSQYSNKDWHRRMGGGAHAESVMDRIVHNAVVIEMGDVNMRELTVGKSI